MAVSGGPDSIVLLDALHREGFSVVVAHCNFHLRGEASDADAAFESAKGTGETLPIPPVFRPVSPSPIRL